MNDEIIIPQEEFKFSFSRSSGAGGQNVNKVNTKVTLIWNFLETNSLSDAVKKRFKKRFGRTITLDGSVKISSQRFRTQPRNIADCIEKLHEMIEIVRKAPKRRIKTKPSRSSVKRNTKSRKLRSAIKSNRKKVDY